MTRILMVLRPDEGGAFRHAADLSAGLVARGHDVAVCGPLSHMRDQLGAEVIEVEMPRDISAGGDLRSGRGVLGAIRSFRPDVVHAHGTKGAFYAGMARFRHPRLPLVRTPHGYPFAGYFTSESSKRRYRVIERSLAPLISRVICVCEAERRLAASIGPERRTRVVYNGIGEPPDQPVHPALAALAGPGPLIGAVSGLRPGKGIETLVEAMPAVLDAAPDARVVIAGDGPRREGIEGIARRLGVTESLHLIGETESAWPLLGGIDMLAFSSWAESFPYAILEAMSLALPIVSTDVGGIGEAIEEGESGLLVAPHDPLALAAGLVALIGDRDLAASLGAGAQLRQRERFTLSGMIEGNLGVYGELI